MRSQGDVGVVFGINSSENTSFWSSKNNEQNKFISISLKYSVILEGIGIRNYCVDWYKKYLISCSNDLISWDYQTVISTEEYNPKEEQKFLNLHFDIPKSTPCKFINITPAESYDGQLTNYAFYRIEFFGQVIDPYPQQQTQIVIRSLSCYFFLNIFLLLS